MPRLYRRLVKFAGSGWYWLLDYLYVVRVQAITPFRRRPPASYLEDSPDRPPVILIPGIYESWYFMKPVADRLAEAGYPVHVIDGLGFNRGTIDAMAVVVADYIKLRRLNNCVIVAHSKGGLIGKQLLIRHNGGGHIKRLVALNTPFSGSVYARLIPLRGVRIFMPDSNVLASLNADTAVNRRITSIYGRFDPHIPGGSRLDGAHNIQLPTSGHFRILSDTRVHRAVLQSIKI